MPRALSYLLILMATPTTLAWSGDADAPHHAELAQLVLDALDERQTASISPHLDAYRAGSLDADGELAPQFHRYSPATGDGRAIHYIANASARLSDNLTARDATSEDARQLGILVHVLLDLTQPLHTGNGTIDAAHHAEYERAAALEGRTPDVQPVPPGGGNVTMMAGEAAEASARRAPELEDLLQKEGPWSPRIADLTNETLQEGAQRAARTLASLLPAAANDTSAPPTRAGETPPRPSVPSPPVTPPLTVQEVNAPTASESISEDRPTPGNGPFLLVATVVALAFALSGRAMRGRP